MAVKKWKIWEDDSFLQELWYNTSIHNVQCSKHMSYLSLDGRRWLRLKGKWLPNTPCFLLVFWRMLDILRFLRHEWWCRVHGNGIGLFVSPYRCLFVAPMPASWLRRNQLSQTDQAVSHGSLYQECCRSCISMKAASQPKRLRSMVENCFKLEYIEGLKLSF